MKILLPFIFSAIIPGTGQLYLRHFLKGFLMLVLPFSIIYFVPEIPITYPYLICQIVSLADIYLTIEKREGKKKALTNLVFGLVIVIIIIPITIYLFTLSLYKGGLHFKDEILSSDQTKKEMSEISTALENYYAKYNRYPVKYDDFVRTKPIWNRWREDSWGTKYEYEVTEPNGYILKSAGKDQIFDTPDDVVKIGN